MAASDHDTHCALLVRNADCNCPVQLGPGKREGGVELSPVAANALRAGQSGPVVVR